MSNQTVTTTAAQLKFGAVAMTRTDLAKRWTVQNLGTGNLYLGNDNTVTASNGYKLVSGAVRDYLSPLQDGNGQIWAISDGTCDVRFMPI